MAEILGIAGAAALFALFGWTTIRQRGDGCSVGDCSACNGACSLPGDEASGDHGSHSSWWPADGATHGDRR